MLCVVRCGLLQEGDRVVAINGVSLAGRAIDECRKLLNDSGMRITLLTQFDVAGAHALQNITRYSCSY